MIITSHNEIPDHIVIEALSIVKGNSVRSRIIGQDRLANIRSLFGDEIIEYTKILGKAREQSIGRMIF